MVSRRTLQRHDWQMFATFDEVDLERELIYRLTGNQRLRLRTPRLPRPPRSWLASRFKIGGWKRVMDLVWGAVLVQRLLRCTCVPRGEREKKLIEAARQGDLPAVKQFVADGVDVNATLAFNITALWQASSKGHRDVVEFLRKSKVDPSARDGVWHMTPLSLTDDVEIISLLVQHGARDVDVKLRSAAWRGSGKLVRAIVDAKPIDKRLLAAAKAQAELGSHKQIVQLLDKVAGQQLPNPPQVAEEKLKTYAGTVSTIENLVTFYVDEHNSQLPHSAFRGQTPDEMYFGVLVQRL